MRGMIPEVADLVAMRFKAIICVRNGDTRSRSTRDMGDVVALVVVNRSDLRVAAGRRDPIRAVTMVAWSS